MRRGRVFGARPLFLERGEAVHRVGRRDRIGARAAVRLDELLEPADRDLARLLQLRLLDRDLGVEAGEDFLLLRLVVQLDDRRDGVAVVARALLVRIDLLMHRLERGDLLGRRRRRRRMELPLLLRRRERVHRRRGRRRPRLTHRQRRTAVARHRCGVRGARVAGRLRRARNAGLRGRRKRERDDREYKEGAGTARRRRVGAGRGVWGRSPKLQEFISSTPCRRRRRGPLSAPRRGAAPRVRARSGDCARGRAPLHGPPTPAR